MSSNCLPATGQISKNFVEQTHESRTLSKRSCLTQKQACAWQRRGNHTRPGLGEKTPERSRQRLPSRFPCPGPFTVSPGGPPRRALMEDRKLGKWGKKKKVACYYNSEKAHAFLLNYQDNNLARPPRRGRDEAGTLGDLSSVSCRSRLSWERR